MEDRDAFGTLIEAIRPWLGDLVVVGGWAHQLHHFLPLASPPRHRPLRTRDADLAFSPDATLTGSIANALARAGFHQELSSDETPPVSQYSLGTEDQGFYVEFVVPLTGSGSKRDGTANATFAKAGVTAQKLRHVELLLRAPATIRLGSAADVPLAAPIDVKVANPVSFLAQKLLIQRYRNPRKQAQDALYIHDTLQLFGGHLDSLRTMWDENVRPALSQKAIAQIERGRRDQFGTVTEIIRAAARMPQDRTLDPEELRVVCQVGLREIFGKV